ncbi:MAG: flagellar biosynthetic protein FliO [Desulfobacteraceae bacterium]|nr:flagellar biosynthetic protein FliO [Desulfobacteraceae bacterium]
MSASPEIWTAFARTFFMLCVVLLTLVLLFYIIKRVSKKSGRSRDGLISVLAVHYISPKEKILLLDVLNEKILIGVTPQNISQLATIDNDMDLTQKEEKKNMKFADFLSGKLMKNKALDKIKDKE